MTVSVTATGMTAISTTVEVETTSGVWFKLEKISGFTPPNAQVDQVDVTHLESTDGVREFIPGLTTLGDASIPMNYIPGSDTDTYIVAWRVTNDVRRVRVTYPTGVVDIFPAFPTGYSPELGDGSTKSTATLALKAAGAFEARS